MTERSLVKGIRSAPLGSRCFCCFEDLKPDDLSNASYADLEVSSAKVANSIRMTLFYCSRCSALVVKALQHSKMATLIASGAVEGALRTVARAHDEITGG